MDDSHKRRRGLNVVTPNACTECRKKRAKCDGGKPCGRCSAQKKLECIYEIPVRQSKENMRAEIEQLRTQNEHSEKLFAALVSSDKSDEVLEQLRSGQTIETVLEKLNIGAPGTTPEHGKGKGRGTTTEEDEPMTDVSGPRRVTTYAGASSNQAITSAIRPLRGFGSGSGSPPSSTVAFSDTQNNTIMGMRAWNEDEARNSAYEGEMKWSPSDSRFEFPLVGTWHHQTRSDSEPDSTTERMRAQGRETMLGDDIGDIKPDNRADEWTEVTSDRALVEHFMALYFCWEYPTFASLSKEHFLEDFAKGHERHCSSLLVNAMLAVGCRFSTLNAARTDPSNSDTAGDHFFAEALRLLAEEDDRHIMTTIQALGLMSIREASCGRSSEAIFYSGQSMRLAVEMGLHMEVESGRIDEAGREEAVRAATFWGAFALDQCWCLCTGRLPVFSRDISLTPTPSIIEEVEASPWIPYTDDGDDLSARKWQRQLTGDAGAPLERNCTQPSNVRSVYKTFCELSEIVHHSLYSFYTPGQTLTSKRLLEIYTQYLKWYDAIPDALRLGENFTPAVLFAHMYYHFALVLLFRPFIKLDIIGSTVSPRDVYAEASESIQKLVNSYSKLYTLRRTPSFVPYFVLTSTISHIVAFGSGHAGPERIHQGISDLTEMTGSHRFAARARDILRFLAAHWEVDVKLADSHGQDDPKTLSRPRSTSLNYFCPNIESLDMKSSFRLNTATPLRPEEDLLFWSFPLQGRPLMDLGSKLRESGFVYVGQREGH